MSFFEKQSIEKRKKYLDTILNVAALSNLFTEDVAAPYLVPRAAENIFCHSLNAKNLGRDDSAIDAKLGVSGIGIKTFLHSNGNTLQKIAEFNRENMHYGQLDYSEKIHYIAKLRNARLQFAINNYEVSDLIYHCVTREKNGTVNFFESPMDFINLKSIKNIKPKNNTIHFSDGQNEYSFSNTKSTLYKRFNYNDDKYLITKIHVDIIKDPYSLLSELMKSHSEMQISNELDFPKIVLPLYSFNNSIGKFVPEKSGLNQWNASGRSRHINEVYIPIPAKIHHVFPDFFPPRDKKFNLKLPNEAILSAKVCQDNNKALMSDPNKALGQWLLRKVLRLEENELLTYMKLEEINVDSVEISKIDKSNFEIRFLKLGSFDEFSIKHSL